MSQDAPDKLSHAITIEPFMTYSFLKNLYYFYLFMYLAAPGLHCGTRTIAVAWDLVPQPLRTLNCGMWKLVSQPGTKSKPPALGAQSPSHLTTREVLHDILLTLQFYPSPISSCPSCTPAVLSYWKSVHHVLFSPEVLAHTFPSCHSSFPIFFHSFNCNCPLNLRWEFTYS